MDLDPLARGDKADDLVSRNRMAALGVIVHHVILGAIEHDAAGDTPSRRNKAIEQSLDLPFIRHHRLRVLLLLLDYLDDLIGIDLFLPEAEIEGAKIVYLLPVEESVEIVFTDA
jgi:hypothetical protein